MNREPCNVLTKLYAGKTLMAMGGEQESKDESIQDPEARLQTALSMQDEGLPYAVIKQATDLTDQELLAGGIKKD